MFRKTEQCCFFEVLTIDRCSERSKCYFNNNSLIAVISEHCDSSNLDETNNIKVKQLLCIKVLEKFIQV